MIFTPTPLAGSYVVDLEPYQDDRGWFARTFCKEEFRAIRPSIEWVQLNHSFTRLRGTIRGMHFQKPPYSEIKLIRCVAGAVWDVIIDLRRESPTFLNWFGIELSASNRKMIYVPELFAHGFQTQTENCELIYHHSQAYRPEAEGGLRYDDPQLNIHWPLPPATLSQRDLQHITLTETFEGL
ncbi:MAG: dTDP-4-dehydrorhamnose 3,5-epimerase [Bacteroidia bacterium]|nr:dTDP-4-dehydrorhamnose 3,5-epimerase [Bacteroidia bacterium]